MKVVRRTPGPTYANRQQLTGSVGSYDLTKVSDYDFDCALQTIVGLLADVGGVIG